MTDSLSLPGLALSVKRTFINAHEEDYSEEEEFLSAPLLRRRRSARTCPNDLQLGSSEPAPEMSPAANPLAVQANTESIQPPTITPEPDFEPEPDRHSAHKMNQLMKSLLASSHDAGAYDDLSRWSTHGSFESHEVQSPDVLHSSSSVDCLMHSPSPQHLVCLDAILSPHALETTSHSSPIGGYAPCSLSEQGTWTQSQPDDLHFGMCLAAQEHAPCDSLTACPSPFIQAPTQRTELRLLRELMNEDTPRGHKMLPPPPPPFAAPGPRELQSLPLRTVRTKSISACCMSGDFSEDQMTPIVRRTSEPLQCTPSFFTSHSAPSRDAACQSPHTDRERSGGDLTIDTLLTTSRKNCMAVLSTRPAEVHRSSDTPVAKAPPPPPPQQHSAMVAATWHQNTESSLASTALANGGQASPQAAVPWWGVVAPKTKSPLAKTSSAADRASPLPPSQPSSVDEPKAATETIVPWWGIVCPKTKSLAAPSSAEAKASPQPPLLSAAFDDTEVRGPSATRRRHHHRRRSPQEERLWCHLYINPCMLQEGFDLVKKIIGRDGCNTKRIYEETYTKVRVRGKGSGHFEVRNRKEAPVPLMLALAADPGHHDDFKRSFEMARDLLDSVSQRFQERQRGRRGVGKPLFWVGDSSAASLECLSDALADVHVDVQR
mmetsp:Transcript_137801/g.237886  ORF Transcript_137801/g.237886 Transcript_137801/m.237886 type:complete len:660 (-) Transcript_137801:59-2038(-)